MKSLKSILKIPAITSRFYSGIWLFIIIGSTLFLYLDRCEEKPNTTTSEFKIDTNMPWADRMAESIMKRNKYAWQIEERKSPKWSYTHGLVSLSFLKLNEITQKAKYYDYAKGYADELINEHGVIKNYRLDEFNIDRVNSGKILFPLYQKTKDDRYKKVINTLRTQIEWQPRNKQGGFWHKLIYPWQMWLDGLYMGAPFYAQYASEFDQYECFDDIANQFIVLEKYARDSISGLLYHGWDESRVQKWANRDTGLSPHFWGRAIGWYSMALVDVLDFFPENHPKQKELVGILHRIAKSMKDFQDEETGLWSQIVNRPAINGNYHEATVSSMMAYVFLKSVRKGYLDESYFTVGENAFNGIISNLVEVEEDGEIHLHKCCAVAGLGGDPYRDGSYEYYINEEVRSNDPKGTGPFILASIEYEYLNKKQK